MASRELIEYIRTYSSQGYSLQSIRANLIASGYQQHDVDDAITQAFSSGRQIPWKLVLLVVCILLVLVLAIYGALLFFSPKTVTLRTTISQTQPTLGIGEPVTFERTLFVGGNSPMALEVTTEIVNEQTREKILTEKEQVMISGTDKRQKTLSLPTTAQAGTYLLRITSRTGSETSTATHTFSTKKSGSSSDAQKIPPPQKSPSQNLTSPKTAAPRTILSSPPTSGVCRPTCNDYDPCTLDACQEGKCLFTQKKPCCGNFECEQSETESTCAQDCKVRPLTQGEAIMQIRSRAEELAANNAGDAVNLCRSIAVSAQADSCLKSVAFSAQRSDVCGHITSIKLKDACYLDFALKNKQSSICENVQDRWMKQSCVVYTSSTA